MRKQIAAANWKMNLSLLQAEELVNALLLTDYSLSENQLAILGVPFPYILPVKQKLDEKIIFMWQHRIVLPIKTVHIQAK